MTKRVFELGGHRLTLSNLDKELWPGDGLTKWDLIMYMATVGPELVPHLRNRPLTVVRFPNGILGHSFYQKDAPGHTPDWIASYPVVADDGERTIRYILANDVPTLVWLANQGAIEYHPWMSQTDRPEYPNYAVIDLDPSEGATFDDAREVAAVAKAWLDRLGIRAVPKTSGATGIHIVIPIEPIYPYSVTSRFIGLLARLIEMEIPGRVTTERMVKNRPLGTVYVDHLQNLAGKTIVAPFSPRPRPGAPVSAPFPWSKLQTVEPHHFTLRNPGDLLGYGREYAAALSARQRIERALESVRSVVFQTV